MPFLHIFVVKTGPLLGTILLNGCAIFSVVSIRKKAMTRSSLQQRIKTEIVLLVTFKYRGLLHLAWYCIITNDP